MACKVLAKHRFYQTLCRSMSSAESEVLFSQHGKAGLVSLNRPKALNALNSNMVSLITQQLVQWSSDPGIETVLVEGGEKAFCAGGDVVSLTNGTDPDPLHFFHTEFQMNHLIGRYSKPYIALIHGITMGGGVGLSVHGKYRIATERSMYAMPETGIGYFPDVGASYFLSRLPSVYGLFLGLTGHRLKGGDLKHLGIATHYIDSSRRCEVKEAVLGTTGEDVESVLNGLEDPVTAPFSLAPHSAVIEECFSGDSVPDIISRLEKDGSDFSVKLLATLAKMCPISLCLTHAMLTRAKALTYEQCFAVELNAAHHVVQAGQFKEGVRALLIDKDNSPQWSPSTLRECSVEMVEGYFTPSGREEWQPLQL